MYRSIYIGLNEYAKFSFSSQLRIRMAPVYTLTVSDYTYVRAAETRLQLLWDVPGERQQVRGIIIDTSWQVADGTRMCDHKANVKYTSCKYDACMLYHGKTNQQPCICRWTAD